MPSPKLLRQLAESLGGVPRVRGPKVSYTEIADAPKGVPVPLPDEVADTQLSRLAAEGKNRRFLRDKTTDFGEQPIDELDLESLEEIGVEPPPEVPGVNWHLVNESEVFPTHDESVSRQFVDGEWVGVTSPARQDEVAYGKQNMPSIIAELSRRAEGAPVRAVDMPSATPDADDPLHHYFGDLLIQESGGRDGSFIDTAKRRVELGDYKPGTIRHEIPGHGGTLGINGAHTGTTLATNWLGFQKKNDVIRSMVDEGRSVDDATHSQYLSNFSEAMPYVRDMKYQSYYGLQPNEDFPEGMESLLTRPKERLLDDQLAAESADFQHLMDMAERRGPVPIDGFSKYGRDELMSQVYDVYKRLDPEGQKRLAKMFALLSASPLVMAGAGDESEGTGTPQ